MKTLSILIFSLALLVAGVGVSACNRSDRVEAARETDRFNVNDRDNVLSADEKDFTDYAAEMHVGEINLAELAKQKSTNDDVKSYADDVIAGHTDALKQLSDATRQNRTLKTTKGSLDTKYHSQYLTPLSGTRFDREFIALMIADHKDAAETFRAQLNTTQNEELKEYLKGALPILESGLSDAQKIQEKLTATSNK